MPPSHVQRRIRKLAELSVMKVAGYSCLAVAVTMSGIAFHPALAFRWGAVFMLVLALSLELGAWRYRHVRRIHETEVWNMLAEDERPSREAARPLIIAAMVDQLRQKALWAGYVAAGLWVVAVALRLTLPPPDLPGFG